MQTAVTSFSLREQLGPIRFEFRDPTGAPQVMSVDLPQLLTISEFVGRAHDELGVDLVETVGFHFTGLDDPEIDRFEKALADTGTGLLNIALDMGDLLDPDADRRAADVAVLKRWIARFAAMGSPFVRVNPGSPASTFGAGDPPPHVAAALVELGDFARAEGSRLLIENHSGPSSNAAWVHAVLDQAGGSCGLLLDLGNLEPLLSALRKATQGRADIGTLDLAADLAGLDLEPLYTALDSLAPRAELVSVKVNWVADDGSLGAVDLDRAMGILVAHGFDGVLSTEYEGWGGDPWAKTRRVIEASRDAFLAAQQR